MADMREAMLKAGLISRKEARRSKHKERVHRKEVGHDGVEKERKERDAEFRAQQEEKRRRDRELEAERQERQQEERTQALEAAGDQDLVEVLRNGVIQRAAGGGRRFFFEVDGGRITFLDLTDLGSQSLLDGSAAIVDSLGVRKEPYCVVDHRAAAVIKDRKPEIVRYWAE